MAFSKAIVIDLVRQYTRRLNENNIPVEKVLLFGSYTKETARVDSDIEFLYKEKRAGAKKEPK